jgi:tRNA modification GTPase
VKDTIYALSSGNLPAAIGVIRVSGPAAPRALEAIAGRVPKPRTADLATLRHPEGGEVIDKALILLFPGPRSETGEDLAEFHIHGGRAVAAALCGALAAIDGLRPAEAGEFTRRAFDNGKLDLTAVEGLADLVAAETESQRRAALTLAGGALAREVEGWQARLLALAARLEAALDFADEGEVGEALPDGWSEELSALAADLARALDRPPAERLRDGVRVVIAGPPNAGKSSLLNALAGRDAAITSAIPGTTRDIVEAPTAIAGVPFLLADTAGLRDSGDEIEAIGVERAHARLSDADTILWLGPPETCPDRSRSLLVQSKADLVSVPERSDAVHLHVSPVTGEGMDALVALLIDCSRGLLPREGEAALNARQREEAGTCLARVQAAGRTADLLVAAEELRLARTALDRLTGRAGVEDMLDALFGRLCIGK